MKIITNDGNDEGSAASGSDGSDDEDRDDVSNASSNDDAPDSSPPQPAQISKTWTALTTHSPCYTGGTVAFSHAPSMTASSTAPAGDDGHMSSSSSHQHFILAQRGGDVSIIEASTGLLLRTVRKGKLFQSGDYNENDDDDDDDDDDEVMDAEAITAFALSPNNVDLIAVTRSHLVRKYSLAIPAAAAEDNEDSKKKRDVTQSQKSKGGTREMSDETIVQSVTSITDPAKVAFSFGKSGHSLPVTKVAFHPSGIFFATGSVDGLVKIWDVRNGYATHALHPTSSDGGGGGSRGRHAVTCLEWRATMTSLILAIGREDGSISIHDLLLNAHDTKTASLPVAVLRDHLSAVTSVTWTSEVGVINAGGGSTASLSSATRRHGGGYFFSSGRDSVINTWLISEEEMANIDGPKRKKKKTSEGDNNQQQQVSITKVSYCRIRTLPIYEQVESMTLLSRKFRPASETKRQKEILDKNDVVLATCGTKGIVRLWKATPGDVVGGIQNSMSDFSLLAAQSDEESFGEGNGGYTSLHLTRLSTTHLSPMLVAIDAEHNMAFLRVQWADDKNALEFATDRAIVGHNGEILDLSVIPQLCDSENSDKHTVAVATNSSQVRIFGIGEAKEDEIGEGNHHNSALTPRGLLDGHTAIVLSIDASPCGRYLVTASKDKTMRLWHISSKKCLAIATGHTEAIGSVALSNKIGCYDVGGKAAKNGAGAFAVTASKDRTLKVWPLPGSAVLTRWSNGVDEEHPLNARLSARAHEKDINIVSVAPNDSLIATGSQDKQVKLWRSTDLALHGTLKGHKRGVWDCQFAPHDRVIATASGDRTLKLWSTTDCNCIRTFQGHMAGVLRVRFLGSGLQMFSSGSDGLIKLWTIRTNECESTMDGHADKVWALDLSPCGTALFSGGADSKIAVWRDTTKERNDAVREVEEQNIMMVQQLSNHLRRKNYEKALDVALELDKPNQVLRVLIEVVEKDTKNGRGIETLQKHVAKWSPDRLTQMLKYCREWNTRARNSHVAMLVVRAVVTTIPAAKLATSYEGIPEILAGISPYAERHFDRLDRMVGDSYLLDFTLASMGSLHGSNNEDYNVWVERRSKYLLPPKEAEGKIQIGGSLIVGGKKGRGNQSDDDSSDDDVVTVGDSDTDASADEN